MHVIDQSEFPIPRIPTMITDVTDDTASMMLLLGGHMECVLLKRSATSVAEWRSVVKNDADYVDRTVWFCAVASSDVIGTARVAISQVRLQSRFFVSVESIPAAQNSYS